jgi:uncharacterized protein YjdB
MRWSDKLSRRVVIMAALVGISVAACKETVTEPITVATVTVTGGGGTLRLGQSAQLTSTLKSTEGWTLPNVGVSWTSSDAAKATISPSGQVTALTRGPVTLTASAGGVTGTGAVTVIGVQSIALAPETLSVIVTQTRAMTATTVLDAGVTVTPTWRSLDTTIAKVDTAGRVTAKNMTGFARIEVTAEDKKDTAVVRVVPIPVVSVSVTPDTVLLGPGQKFQLIAIPKDSLGRTLSGRAATWSSSDNTRATVSDSGSVTAIAQGTANIFATIEQRVGSSAIKIGPPIKNLTIYPGNTTAVSGDTLQFLGSAKDAEGNLLLGRTLSWISADTSIASISSTGLLTAKNAGITTITLLGENAFATATIQVKRNYRADALTGSYLEDQGNFPAHLTIVGGGQPETIQVELLTDSVPRSGMRAFFAGMQSNKVVPINGKATIEHPVWGTGLMRVRFTVFDGVDTIIRTTPSIRVYAARHCMGLSSLITKGIPDTVISGELIQTPTDSVINIESCRGDNSLYRYSVNAELDGISGDSSATLRGTTTSSETVNNSFADLRIDVNKQTNLRIKFSLQKCPDVQWCAPSERNKFVFSKQFVVRQKPVTSIALSSGPFSLIVGSSRQLSVSLLDKSGNTLTGREVIWSSSNPTIASVSNSGLVTGLTLGNTVISVLSEGVSAGVSVTVKENGTVVSGVVQTSARWTKEGSPYRLLGAVQIAQVATVVVDPGVEVWYSDSSSLLLAGSIEAVGTKADSIFFVPESNKQNASNATGLRFLGSANLGASKFKFIVMRGLNSGITVPYAASSSLIIDSSSLGSPLRARGDNDGGVRGTGDFIVRASTVRTKVVAEYPNPVKIAFIASSIVASEFIVGAYATRGIDIINSFVDSSTFRLGCCSSNLTIRGRDSNFASPDTARVRNSQFITGDGSPVNGDILFEDAFLYDSRVNLGEARVTFNRSKIVYSPTYPFSDQLRVGSLSMMDSYLLGNKKNTGIEITGIAGYGPQGTVEIRRSDFRDNVVAVRFLGSTTRTVSVSENNFLNNTLYNVEWRRDTNTSMANNYWGSADDALVRSKIYDGRSNITLGTVSYTPFAMAAFPNRFSAP